MRTAELLLRGIAADVEWSTDPGAPLVLLVGARRVPCLPRDAVVVAPRTGGWRACVSVLEWAADHAAELGADPARVIVAGEGHGAVGAVRLALHARDQGWPELERQLLIHPQLAGLGDVAPAGVAPAEIVTGGGDDGRAFAARLRGAGVPVAVRARFTIVRYVGAPPERVLEAWGRGPGNLTLTPCAGGTKLHLHACVDEAPGEDAEARWSAFVERLASVY